MKITLHPKVEEVFSRYPPEVKEKMLFLKNLVLKTAEEMEEIQYLEITLKWGEPSFITNCGSTLRMDWKEKSAHQYALYFQCTSRLVETFKSVFGSTFSYEGKRAILFRLDQKIPITELKECIKATLRYHKVKNQITLGI